MATRFADKLAPGMLLALGLVGAGFGTLAFAIASLFLPYAWDHGIIGSVATSYIDGGVPFVDSWDMKGPVSYLPFALAELLFGPTMWGVRLMDLAFWALAGIVMFVAMRAITGWKIAAFTALSTYLWVSSAGWLFTAQPESWVTTSLIIGILPLLPSEARLNVAKFILCGFMVGCAGLVKPFYFAMGAAPLVFLALSTELSWRRRFELAVALALGAIIPVVLIAGYFAARGGLGALIEVHLLYTLSSYVKADMSVGDVFAGIASFALKAPIVLTTPFAILGAWARRHDRRLVWTLLAWMAVAFFCMALQAKFYVYHWFAAYPPIFILGALGIDHLLRREARPGLWALVGVVGAGLILAATVARPLRDVVRLVQHRVLSDDIDAYYAIYEFRRYKALDTIAAARYIASHSHPEESVYLWGCDATIPYLANRPDATRFTFLMPLTEPGAYREAYRAQAMEQLNANRPVYFVTGLNWTGEGPASELLEDFPELADYLAANYTFEKSFGLIDIYRRNDAPTIARLDD